MRLVTFTTMFILFFVNFPAHTRADQPSSGKDPITYVVLAFDASNTMYYYDDKLAKQNQALASAVDEYNGGCGKVFVVYMPWGSAPSDSVGFMLSEKSQREKFVNQLKKGFGWQHLSLTPHSKAIRRALTEIQDLGASNAFILFTTDEPGEPVDIEIPGGITILKVSIGDFKKVSTYLSDEFLPGQSHQHVKDAADLKHIISDTFSIASPSCPVS